MHSCETADRAGVKRPDPLRSRAAGLLALSLVLGACATQPQRPAPAPAPAPTAPVAAPATAPVEAPKKTKPKPKPVAAAPAAPAPKANDGLALADVGYYMDVMQGRLQQLTTSGVNVAREGTRLKVTASAVFDSVGGRLELDPAHGRAFAAIAKTLAEYRQTRVTIRTRLPADAAVAAACASALQRYLVGAGVAPQQLVMPTAATAADVPVNATATLELDIAPLVREG